MVSWSWYRLQVQVAANPTCCSLDPGPTPPPPRYVMVSVSPSTTKVPSAQVCVEPFDWLSVNVPRLKVQVKVPVFAGLPLSITNPNATASSRVVLIWKTPSSGLGTLAGTASVVTGVVSAQSGAL